MEDNQFSCQYDNCDKSYKYKGGLSNHYKRNHQNIKPARYLRGNGGFPCNICQKDYSTEESRRKHKCKPILIQPIQQQQQQQMPFIQNNDDQQHWQQENADELQNNDLQNELQNNDLQNEEVIANINIQEEQKVPPKQTALVLFPHQIVAQLKQKYANDTHNYMCGCDDRVSKGYYRYLNHWMNCEEADDKPMEPLKPLPSQLQRSKPQKPFSNKQWVNMFPGNEWDGRRQQEYEQYAVMGSGTSSSLLCSGSDNECQNRQDQYPENLEEMSSVLVLDQEMSSSVLVLDQEQEYESNKIEIGAQMKDIALSPRQVGITDVSIQTVNMQLGKFSPRMIIDNRQQLVDAITQTNDLDNIVKQELDQLREQFRALQHHCPLCNCECTQSHHNSKVAQLLLKKKPVQKAFFESLRFGQQQLVQFGLDIGTSAISRAIQTEDPLTLAPQLIPTDYLKKQLIDKVYSIIEKESDCLQAVKTTTPKPDQVTAKSTRANVCLKEDQIMIDTNAQIGYGEATKGSMEKIIEVLCQYGLNSAQAHFVDIGSGFGKPIFHAAIKTKANCYGLEIVQARVDYCESLMDRLTEEYKSNSLVNKILTRIQFIRVDAGNIHKFQNSEGIDSTHFYSFNWIMSEEDNKSVVDALNETTGFKMLAWCCNEKTTISKFGLMGVKLVNQLQVRMTGSGQSPTIFFYAKDEHPVFLRVYNHHAFQMIPKVAEIDFLLISQQFFGQRMYEKPFVIRNFCTLEKKVTKELVEKEFEKIKSVKQGRMRKFGSDYSKGFQLATYADYMKNPDGAALELPVHDIKPRVLKGFDPSFLEVDQTEADWVVAFLQKNGKDLGSQVPFLQGVYNVTGLHQDEFIDGSPVCSWMVQLQGRKRWYLLPPITPKELEQKEGPTFDTAERVTEYGLKYGLVQAELNQGDLLYFPGDWYHEVHNLDPNILSIAGGPKWPSKRDKFKKMITAGLNLNTTLAIVNKNKIQQEKSIKVKQLTEELMPKEQAQELYDLVKFIHNNFFTLKNRGTADVNQLLLALDQSGRQLGKFKSKATLLKGIKDLASVVPTWIELRDVKGKGHFLRRTNDIQLFNIKDIIEKYYQLVPTTTATATVVDKVKGKRSFKEVEYAEALNRLLLKLDTAYKMEQKNSKMLTEQHYSISGGQSAQNSQIIIDQISDPRTQEVVEIVTELDGEESMFGDMNTWRNDRSVKDSICSRCSCIKKERRFQEKIIEQISQLVKQMQTIQLNQQKFESDTNQKFEQLSRKKKKNIAVKECQEESKTPQNKCTLCLEVFHPRQDSWKCYQCKRQWCASINEESCRDNEFACNAYECIFNASDTISKDQNMDQSQPLSSSASNSVPMLDDKFDTMEDLMIKWTKKGKDRAVCNKCKKEKYWKKSNSKFIVVSGLHQCV